MAVSRRLSPSGAGRRAAKSSELKKQWCFSPTKGREPQVIIQVELVILLFSWGNQCWNFRVPQLIPKPPKSSSEECFPMSAWTCFPPKMGMSHFWHRNKMRWLWCVPKIWSYYKVIKSFLVDMVVILILDLPYTFMVMVCPYGSPGLPLSIFHGARPRRVAWARRSSSSTWAFQLHFNPLWLEKVQPEL